MLSIPVILAIVALFLSYYIYFHARREYLLHKLPGPWGFPFVGNLPSFIVPPADLWRVMHGMNDDYYPIYKISTTKWNIVNMRHPDDVELSASWSCVSVTETGCATMASHCTAGLIYGNTRPTCGQHNCRKTNSRGFNFCRALLISLLITAIHSNEVVFTSPRHITKSVLYEFLQPWFQTGLLTSTGKKWQKRRKILTPAFHFNVLREFVGVFDEEGRRMVNDIKKEVGKNEYDLLPLVTKYTLNTICETAMGTSLEENTPFHKTYRRAVYEMGESILHRLLRPWLHLNFMFNLSPTGRTQKKLLEIVHGFSKNIINERQQYHKDTGDIYLNEKALSSEEEAPAMKATSKKRLAMLDLLIAAMRQGHIDETGIREEVDTFIFEGHDTTGMGMSFALLLLAEHKDIQQLARDEIDAVLKESDGNMSITEIQRFTYLDRCIKESLRLYPSVPLISRQVETDLHLKNYTIPDGVVVQIHIYDLHRDPNFWPDPHSFDPDRFLPERCIGRHPFSYVPFSAGHRNCIGQKFAMLELKALIGHLLHNFYLEPIDLASNVQLLPDLVLRPAKPIHIKFIPRQS